MSIIFFEKALKSLKKANKAQRLIMAGKAGYETVEDYEKFLVGMINQSNPVEAISVEVEPEKSSELTDIVIAFDTTGSMDSYIANVKNHVKTLIPNLFSQNPDLKISIVAFGDYCDMRSSKVFGDAYQVIELSSDENKLISFVNRAKSTGGGDTQEFYELVIKKITEETTWREGSNKSVLLIGDAPPHPVGYHYGVYCSNNQIDWREEARKANKLGIKFDTLSINPSYKWFEELSSITQGVNLPFKNSKKTTDVIEAMSLARGGEKTRTIFEAKMRSKEVTTDSELTAVYSTYSKEIIK